jgi:proline iminopeptidase
MKRKLAIIGIIVAVVFSLGSFVLYHFMTGPMYKSGQVRAGLNLSAPLEPPAQPESTTHFQVSPDIRLHRFEHGDGPVALVVHGGPGSPPRGTWPGLELVAGRRFVYYHQRGCGESTRPFDRLEGGFMEKLETLERKLGLGAQVADIERIRRILGEEKLVIVGHSFGGFIASLYAAEFPERVAALILIGPATVVKMPNDHDDLFETIRSELPEERHAVFDTWRERYLSMNGILDSNEAELAALSRDFGTYWKEAVLARGLTFPEELEIDNNGGWISFAMYFSMGMRHDYSPHLAKVTAPVLVIHSEKDFQSEAASRDYVGFFPNASLAVVKGVGHFPFFEAPEDFATTVRPFLEKL